MNLYGHNFPLLIKNRKVFLKYKNTWLNVNNEILIHGGGLSGAKQFLKNLRKCSKGIHQYETVFHVNSMTSSVQCHYCKLKKKDRNES